MCEVRKSKVSVEKSKITLVARERLAFQVGVEMNGDIMEVMSFLN